MQTTPRRIQTRFEIWIEKALDTYLMNDQVSWEMGFGMTNQGPQILLILFMPSALLGGTIQATAQIPDAPHVTEDQIEEIIKSLLDDLRNVRSQQISVPSNGSKITGDENG